MPMNVEILIQGLAVCFQEGNAWRVVFICDGIHPVNFLHNGTPHAQSPLQRRFTDRDISFTGVANSPASTGAAFNRIFNMAADYAHGPRKLMKFEGNRRRKFISMLIPSASLDTHCLTQRKYFVQEARRGAPVRIIDRVAGVISAKFVVTDPAGLTMIIREQGLPDISVPFPFQDGTPLTLTFDNDCGVFCHENDFYQYYDRVKDKAGKEFVAGQILNSDVPAETIPICPNGDADPSADLGNCDPVAIHPPPDPFDP